jgi:hypothetical protein
MNRRLPVKIVDIGLIIRNPRLSAFGDCYVRQTEKLAGGSIPAVQV